MNEKIIIKGLRQNNLKDVSLEIPKNKIVVFTGVSGSGKSSIVFDTIAAEAARQLNATYPAYMRSRLPKYPKPDCDSIENLSPGIVIDQSPLGSTARSTVGTSSEIYASLRLLFSRIGQPYAGTASCFSFNDPAGLCPTCAGLGKVAGIDVDSLMDKRLSLNGGALLDSTIKKGSWYWKQCVGSGRVDPDKSIEEFSPAEMDFLLNGDRQTKFPGLCTIYRKRYLNRDDSKIQHEKAARYVRQTVCPDCQGRRLNRIALSCWIEGCSIADLCDMELTQLRDFIAKIDNPAVRDLTDSIRRSLTRIIDIGLGYLSLARETQSLSGGEAQRVKLVRHLGSSLSDMLYIFDEPSTGMHPRDVYRMNNLLRELRDKGNTVLVVEHDEDVIAIADEVVDVGPLAGAAGGQIIFQGSYAALLEADTPTGQALRDRCALPGKPLGKPSGFLPVRNAGIHNLKGCDADIPLGCVCVVTGVAGSGKSSLMQVFADTYRDRVIRLDQKPITATNRSTPASYLGIMDEIRKLFAEANGVDEGMFSFNSLGACPHCKGKGVIVTEMAFMDPVATVCEVCGGARYSHEALSYSYKGKNILQALAMTAEEAATFFEGSRMVRKLQSLVEVGLQYLALGQPMSTLSGGERQRIKLATCLGKKGNIYLLDEPTTGLHLSDIGKLMELFRRLVRRGNSVVVVEHNVEVMKQADYIIDIGPDSGRHGGEVVFCGTPQQMAAENKTITARCLNRACGGGHFSDNELEALTSIHPNDNITTDMTRLALNPIGRIEADGTFRILLDPKYREALIGLEGFSHVQILWWFDGCDNARDRSATTVRNSYAHGPELLGTFATRSPARPNPIAVTVAEVLGIDIDTASIELGFIDALPGTPVLDIKPYTPSLDRVAHPIVPDWCRHWPESYEDSGSFDWEKELNI